MILGGVQDAGGGVPVHGHGGGHALQQAGDRQPHQAQQGRPGTYHLDLNLYSFASLKSDTKRFVSDLELTFYLIFDPHSGLDPVPDPGKNLTF